MLPGCSTRKWQAIALAVLATSTSCTWLPREFNLSPIFRQRLDEQGAPLEVDVLWPLFHYERTAQGGHDCRVRPFWRRVTEPQPEVVGIPAVEHQYLWPLGRHRSDAEQTRQRLWPFWSYTSRLNEVGLRQTDWYALFPLFWGGWREDGDERYFGLFPLFADLPDFLTYRRLTFVLWPLYTRTEKERLVGHTLLWPLIGFGGGDRGYDWLRVLPLFSYSASERYQRWSVLWPFVHWAVENLHTEEPVRRYLVWPLWGEQWSERTWGFTVAWPLFQFMRTAGQRVYLDFLWPVVRYEEDRRESRPLLRWWLWPLVARTITDDQSTWNLLWPLIWLREFGDPQGSQQHAWFVPFYTSVDSARDDGSANDFRRFWPLFQSEVTTTSDGERLHEWSTLAPWLFRGGLAYGVFEAYDWLWTLAQRRRRAPDDRSFDLAAQLFTTRTRGETTQGSVPFLFNYETDQQGGVLRLFQFLPITWGTGGATAEADAR